MKSWTDLKSKGWVSDFVAVYSPGRRRKKKAMVIMSLMPTTKGSVDA